MSSAPNFTAKTFWKSKKFWLILLFLIYSVFGWFGVPYIVKQQTIGALKDLARWDTKIESVVFNPYALSLAVHGFQARDEFDKEAVRFDRLFVNFSALDSLTGRIAFDEISLAKPIISAALDKNGLSNFERDFVSNDGSDTSEEPVSDEGENSDPLALFFGLVTISNGQIIFADHRSEELFQLTLDPLNLALHNFSTDHNDGGDYSLKLSLGNGQELDWQGQIGIAPFTSKGDLTLKDLRASSFWHYAKPYSPYALQESLISLSASYDTEFSEQVSRFVIDTGSFSIAQFKLGESLDSPAFFAYESLNLSPISFDLEAKEATLGTLEINKPQLFAKKETDAQLNLLRPLDTHQAPDNAEPSEENEVDDSQEAQTPFKWSLAAIELNDGLVNWQDASLESPADLSIDQINVVLGKISDQLEVPFTYQLSFNTGESKQNLQGNLSAMPFNIDGDMALSSLPLTWLQPYLGEQLNVLLDQGQLNLNAKYNLAMADNGLSGTIETDSSVKDFTLKDSIEQNPLAGFQSFSISGLNLALNGDDQAPAITIDEVKLSQPFANAQISEQGEMNLARISKAPAVEESEQDNETAEQPSEASKEDVAQIEEKASPDVVINSIVVESGRFDYVDASLNPVFNTYIDQFSGKIQNLSSAIDARSSLSLAGNLDSYGQIAINGTTNPLSEKPNTLLDIQVNNIDLSTASPYSAKYAGYLIDKGKLNLDLNYDIKGSKLKADNAIFIDQFNFGDSVDSPDATILPLPLALGIMKNLDGEIDIDLPISGDLNDPSFSLGGVILTAFTNLITKVVTSPFSILGSLVEGSDDISSVDFASAQTELQPTELAKVLKLADALKKRPNLSLEVRGVADRTVDLDNNQQAMSEEKLAVLAKSRALVIAKALKEQGNIAEQRIFTLEPKVIASSAAGEKEESLPTVPSIFTVKVD